MLREPLSLPVPFNSPIEEITAPTDSKLAQQAAVELRLDLLQKILTLLMAELKRITNAANLNDNARSFNLPVRMAEEVANYESQLIREALEATGNRQNRAAQLLGIKYTTLNSKIRKYNLIFRRQL